MLTIENDNGDPAMYIINYKNDKGFIITSATQDYSPVLAYSEDGYFDINKTKGHPIEVWIEQEMTNIVKVQEAADSIKYKFRSQWLPYVLTPIHQPQEPITKGGYEEVRSFIKACHTNFTPNGSFAYNTDAASALHSYGYTNATIVNHDVKYARLNIPAHIPVYMSGSRITSDGTYIGHAWVCDGIKNTVPGYEIVLKVLQNKTNFYTQNYGVVEALPSTYLHMNWGYSGSYNAFYNDNNIKLPNDRDYKYNRQDIINITH